MTGLAQNHDAIHGIPKQGEQSGRKSSTTHRVQAGLCTTTLGANSGTVVMAATQSDQSIWPVW